jgi:hypothetical protein
MGFSTDFFTVDIPDQDTLVFYRLVNIVPRLKEIQGWLDWLLDPFDRGLSGWASKTKAEKDAAIPYILEHDYDGLQTYIEGLFPTELPADIQQIIENFLYGYYFDTLEVSNTLSIDIDANAYQTLPSGMKVQYKPSRTSKTVTMYTLGNDYNLVRWRKLTFEATPAYYEVWAVLYYDNVWTAEVKTWQYQKSSAAANQAAFGGTITLQGPTIFGDDNTFYEHNYTGAHWATIGIRRETFLPLGTHYYDHDVNPQLIFTTDPATRGGIYASYLSDDWEYHTDHPETMGNPWAGDDGERPFPDNLYNWISSTVNPPGYTDLSHEFLMAYDIKEIFYGEGRDPEVYARRGAGGTTPAILTGLTGVGLPIQGLVGIFRPKKRS